MTHVFTRCMGCGYEDDLPSFELNQFDGVNEAVLDFNGGDEEMHCDGCERDKMHKWRAVPDGCLSVDDGFKIIKIPVRQDIMVLGPDGCLEVFDD